MQKRTADTSVSALVSDLRGSVVQGGGAAQGSSLGDNSSPRSGSMLLRGTVWTGVPGDSDHFAVAVEEGIIVSFDADALAWAEAASVDEVDMKGGFLMPAFGEGHAHPIFGALESEGPQIRGCTSVAAILSEVAGWAERHPEEEWIVGASYDSSLAPEGLFDARWLDQAVADRPVMLRARDYHTVWCNSLALKLAGIS